MEEQDLGLLNTTRGAKVYETYLIAEKLVEEENFDQAIGVDQDSLQEVFDVALTAATNSIVINEDEEPDEELFPRLVNRLQVIAFAAGVLHAQANVQVGISSDEVTELIKSLLTYGTATVQFIVDGDA